jgi:hypothetical protein
MKFRNKVCLYFVLVALSPTQFAFVYADDQSDCQNKSLPAEYVLQACRRFMRSLTNSPIGETNIIGTFNGCEYGKVYPLFNGWDMECRTYRYHYSFQPKVQILDNSTAIIDGDEYSVFFR